MFAAQSNVRTSRFGMGAVILRSNAGLQDEEIQARAPSVFADEKHASRSSKYTYIPTRELLAGLRSAGLVPVEVRQGGSRDEEKRGFTKHMIRLRRAEDAEDNRQIGDVIPEVIALNSHDGTSSYVLSGGLYRKVCMNGLHVAAGKFDEVRVPHKGDIIGQVIEGSYRVVESLPAVVEASREWSGLMLAPPEQAAFARAAAELRFDAGAAQPEPERMLGARRVEDRGADLWRTFNRVQENLIRGGVQYVATNEEGKRQVRQSRPVRSIDGDRAINRALWTLAEEMRKLKAA